MLYGEGNNGKSVVYVAALTALLGEANVSHVELEKFGDRFALTSTLGWLGQHRQRDRRPGQGRRGYAQGVHQPVTG